MRDVEVLAASPSTDSSWISSGLKTVDDILPFFFCSTDDLSWTEATSPIDDVLLRIPLADGGRARGVCPFPIVMSTLFFDPFSLGTGGTGASDFLEFVVFFWGLAAIWDVMRGR